jgi:hypothetical protein
MGRAEISKNYGGATGGENFCLPPLGGGQKWRKKLTFERKVISTPFKRHMVSL